MPPNDHLNRELDESSVDGIGFASIFRKNINHWVVWAMGVRLHPKLGLIEHTLGVEPSKKRR